MRKLLFTAALAVIILAALIVPLPVAVLSPGPAIPVSDRVDIEGAAPEDIEGRLLMTTVSVDDASATDTISAMLDDDRDVVARRQVVPRGVDEDEFFEVQRRLFEESARIAVAVGARAAGFDVEVTGNGAHVVGIVTGGPADGELREGDVIVGIEGEGVEVASDLVAVTRQHDVGDVVELTVQRGDEEQTIEVELGRVGQVEGPALGVAVRTLELQIDLPREVDVDTEEIGGPSAGLMIALTAFDQLDDGDLVSGRTIAGTGTVTVDGRVGPVGGVRQKVEGARERGADVFLIPEQEAEAARDAAGDDLDVVAVSSFEEAVDALSEE